MSASKPRIVQPRHLTASEPVGVAATRKLYNTLAVLGYLIGIVAPATEWRKHLADLVASCPLAGAAAMGFPNDWKEMPAWQAACA